MATQMLTTYDILAPKTTTNTNTSAAMSSGRTRAYKDFLTPALHRRFTSSAGVLLVFCWFGSWLLSRSGHIFWSWFLVGPAGVRALLLFIPCLAVFVLRVANLHVGHRTASSSAEIAYNTVVGGSAAQAVGWYLFSSWFFCEVYIYSKSEDAGLSWVDPGQVYERPRLNENAIALRFMFCTLGLVQAAVHIRHDWDKIDLPVLGTANAIMENSWLVTKMGLQPGILATLPRPLQELALQSGSILKHSFDTTTASLILTIVFYGFLGLRYLIWRWAYPIAAMVFWQLPPAASRIGLVGLFNLLFQAWRSAMMITFLWRVSNIVFDAVVAQAPLKKGELLTSEVKDARGVVLYRSRDPNGSLLTGLKSKKEVLKNFAFWELVLLCDKYEGRRKTIYTEIDRESGTTWSQVCAYALKEVETITQRIKAAKEPVVSNTKQQDQQQQQLIAHNQEQSLGLKKIADQAVRDDANLFRKSRPDLAGTLGNFTKSIGQSPGGNDHFSQQARKAIEWSTHQVLSPEHQQRLTPKRFQQDANGYLVKVIKTPIGAPFRQSYVQRVSSVICGSPTSSQITIMHATKALTKLCICSLKEDDYGQVQKDVAKIIRTFSETISEVEKFVKDLQPSWTDVNFQESDRKATKDVDEILQALKGGLEEILLAFGEYTSALGLSKKAVREAKEAATKPTLAKVDKALPEPQQQRRAWNPAEGVPEMEQIRSHGTRKRINQ